RPSLLTTYRQRYHKSRMVPRPCRRPGSSFRALWLLGPTRAGSRPPADAAITSQRIDRVSRHENAAVGRLLERPRLAVEVPHSVAAHGPDVVRPGNGQHENQS